MLYADGVQLKGTPHEGGLRLLTLFCFGTWPEYKGKGLG